MLRSKVKLTIYTCVSLLLAGCSSAPKTVKLPVKAVEVTEVEAVIEDGPDELIDKAQDSYVRTGDLSLRNGILLEAAQAFQSQQQCHQALKIIHLLKPELSSSNLLTHANVIQAECYLEAPKADIEKIQNLLQSSKLGLGYDRRIYRLKSHVQEHNQQWLEAAKSVLLSGYDDQFTSAMVWKLLQNLDKPTLNNALNRETALKQWLELTSMTQQLGLAPAQLRLAVEQWQDKNQDHILNQYLPDEVTQAISLEPISTARVAIILPLSGRLASQGLAIKQGVLSAYYQTPSNLSDNLSEPPFIQFFDSNAPALPAAEQLESFDVIIGPLLKNKIVSLLSQTSVDQTILALNRIDTNAAATVSPNQYFFALAPEDEARQLAETVFSNNARNPVIIADKSAATTRMANAFMAQWLELSSPGAKKPKITVFTDNTSLRASMTEALDVKQSKDRIKVVESLITEELHAVPRNRRDVDAIVVFANAEQTELLNPIIESSLSPFNDKKVPVYATHRSYSLNLSNNSLRDLRNLTFSDMPWMLPEHKWQTVSQETEALWPQRSDTLRRLFALGFDSYNLIPKLHALRALPKLSVEGLTGKLSIQRDGSIRRILPYGFINNDKVSLIAMD